MQSVHGGADTTGSASRTLFGLVCRAAGVERLRCRCCCTAERIVRRAEPAHRAARLRLRRRIKLAEYELQQADDDATCIESDVYCVICICLVQLH